MNRADVSTALHAHPATASANLCQILPVSRHIILPEDLRKNPGAFSSPEINTLLDRIFPNSLAIELISNFLVCHYDKLPPRPWPRTVGGLSLYLTSAPGDSPLPLLKFTGANFHLLPDKEGRDLSYNKSADPNVDTLIFNPLINYFEEIPVSITEIHYWDNYVTVVLEHRHATRDFPRSIAGIGCFYLFEEDIHRPTLSQAKRAKDVSLNSYSRDNSSYYPNLRPGLILSSEPSRAKDEKGNLLRDEMFTTSGVLVRDNLGNAYMTVSSHGFPNDGEVWHPNPNGHVVADLVRELSGTDVALAKLRPGVHFVNETFEHDIHPHGVRLSSFVAPGTMKIGDFVWMDSPYTGLLDGTFQGIAKSRLQNHDGKEHRWIKTMWIYDGQGCHDALERGICGTPVWTKDNGEGQVLGFFWMAMKDGMFKDWCLSIAAEEFMGDVVISAAI